MPGEERRLEELVDQARGAGSPLRQVLLRDPFLAIQGVVCHARVLDDVGHQIEAGVRLERRHSGRDQAPLGRRAALERAAHQRGRTLEIRL